MQNKIYMLKQKALDYIQPKIFASVDDYINLVKKQRQIYKEKLNLDFEKMEANSDTIKIPFFYMMLVV